MTPQPGGISADRESVLAQEIGSLRGELTRFTQEVRDAMARYNLTLYGNGKGIGLVAAVSAIEQRDPDSSTFRLRHRALWTGIGTAFGAFAAYLIHQLINGGLVK